MFSTKMMRDGWAEPPASSEDAPGRSHTCPRCPWEPCPGGHGRRKAGPIRGVKSLPLPERSHRDLNSDRWIQSPECSPLHHGTPLGVSGLRRQRTVSDSWASRCPTHKLRAVLLRPWGDSSTVDSLGRSSLLLSLCSSPSIDAAHSHLRKWGEIHFGFCARGTL